ncbi:MAG: thioredoxin family protein [Betaproteobacteria bacterium]|nr:thioredoxin family protein [Betaproteobacteria bacterium]
MNSPSFPLSNRAMNNTLIPLGGRLLGLLCALLIATTAAQAAVVKTPHVEAELIALQTGIQPGSTLALALRLNIIEHWHTYWQNPGDSGLPTKLTWRLPAGFSAGPIQWPYPKKLPLGPLMNFGYEGEVLHLVDIQVPASLKPGEPITLAAKADWLVCSDVCIPESADLSLTLPVSAAPALDNRWEAPFKQARNALPGALAGWKVTAQVMGKNLNIALQPPLGETPDLGELSFYPRQDDVMANAEKQILQKTADGFRLTAVMAEPLNTELKTLDGVLVSTGNWGKAHAGRAVAIAAPVSYMAAAPKSAAANASADMGLIAALAFAFIGGLILNLMPCVFPVLGIKVMSFVQLAHGETALMRKQGITFLIGVLVSFWLLAGLLLVLRAAGEAIGWGFQLQSPVFVTLLAALFMLMALNLAGVFEMGLSLQTAAGNLEAQGKRSTLADAFFSGVLATIVATPCTAPFMGAALGFTLSQPAYVSMLVFTAIAIGMALPVLTLSLVPRWLKLLPKPGAWMTTFKQFMAFPLLATVVWLAWVLGAQQGNDGIAKLLFGLVLLALAAWLFGRWQMQKPLRALVTAALIGGVGLMIAWPSSLAQQGASGATKAEDDWVPFSKQKIAELRASGKAVFVDFTATWCITCQVNKRIALNQPEVVKRFGELGIVRMKADWTLKDPVITETLAEFGRNGVPLYVFYPVAGEASVLPEVLTPAVVLAAVDTGAPEKR